MPGGVPGLVDAAGAVGSARGAAWLCDIMVLRVGAGGRGGRVRRPASTVTARVPPRHRGRAFSGLPGEDRISPDDRRQGNAGGALTEVFACGTVAGNPAAR